MTQETSKEQRRSLPLSARTGWQRTTNRLTEAVAHRRALGAEMLDLSESNPTRCGFRYDEARILAALAQPQALDYRPDPRGHPAARQAVAAYYAERGVHVEPDSIVLTASTSEAYSFLFRLLCDPGDQVLVPAPSYPLFDFLADLNDLSLRSYPLAFDHDAWRLDLHALEAAIHERTRAVLVVHPNNPTGSYMKRDEAEALSALCAARGLAIIADEVFIDFPVEPLAPVASFAAENAALTFTLSGLSKIAALPQMKLAWLVASGPDELKREALSRLEIIADTYLSLATPLQLALPTLLEERHAMQPQLAARVLTNLRELDRQLAEHPACQRLPLEGGWYAVLRIPATRSDEDLTVELVERHGVLVHPGHFYDFPHEGYVVLSLIVREEEFGAGARRMLKAIDEC